MPLHLDFLSQPYFSLILIIYFCESTTFTSRPQLFYLLFSSTTTISYNFHRNTTNKNWLWLSAGKCIRFQCKDRKNIAFQHFDIALLIFICGRHLHFYIFQMNALWNTHILSQVSVLILAQKLVVLHQCFIILKYSLKHLLDFDFQNIAKVCISIWV